MRPRPRLIPTTLAVVLGAVAALSAGACSSSQGSQELVRVPADAATITDAVERVAPGGTVLVAAGTYPEQVLLSTTDVTIRGEDRNATVITGEGKRPYGIVATADGARIENLTVRETTFYGVLVTGLHDENGPSAHNGDGYTRLDPDKFPPVRRFSIDHVTAANNGLYGIYAFDAHDGVIQDSYASGSADSGFYVGQCRQCGILVTGNVAERNAVGFENANASDSVMIAGNRFSGNRVGMTLISNYQEAFTPQRANTVVGNLLADNAEPDSPAQASGSFGLGLGISGGIENALTRNRISGNPVAGVQLANTEDLAAASNAFTGNAFEGNGVDLANTSATRAPAAGNCADGTPTTSPADLLAPCPGTAAQPAAPLEGTSVPRGTSFLRVASPVAQPDMGAWTGQAAPLPARVTMPDPAGFPVPPADFLAAMSGTA
ncbi:right-handed parallel beta-helix repeat-containing protein [Cellulomonas edaphi]|uniref:Right-handed parallel beta-helix repeat-containing protein n=1 Tax=Cellulomonas edaphi TaxID=3053468 RepID=A0ABT7S410_9CELL|nr:right-handed parallel beta-helix repeat-containing protein [Cellulomons edaphi]MDM7830354.1 right-handed parallel beta-helix repeat-containing protein [Cellulomons edaphi]